MNGSINTLILTNEEAERDACAKRIMKMYKRKYIEPEHGVTHGYTPTLQDYLNAVYDRFDEEMTDVEST